MATKPPGGHEAIRVEGLAQFQRELRRVSSDFPRELRLANLEAAEVVATAARAKARSLGGVARKTEPSIKAAAEQRRAKVSFGGPKFPFAMGAEFGGGKYGPGNPTARGGYTTQFKAWRGNDSGAGYFVFPEIRRTKDPFLEVYEKALFDLIERAFTSRVA